MCNQYFSKLTFVLRYYLHEIPDWRYVYKYHYAPFFYDMFKNIKSFDSKCKFNKNESATRGEPGGFYKNAPFNNLQQLISILPRESINILPEELQILFNDNSPIIHMYPTEFVIDNEGKKTDHESIIILPFVDDNLLINEFNKIQLSENSKKLNINGKINYY
jgi:5'-3' exonuclease